MFIPVEFFYQLLHCAHMCKWSPEDCQAKTQAVPFSANGYRLVVEEMTIYGQVQLDLCVA